MPEVGRGLTAPFGASSGGDGELERMMELARVRAVRAVELGPAIPDFTRSLLPALEPRPEDRMNLAELLELLAAELPEGGTAASAW